MIRLLKFGMEARWVLELAAHYGSGSWLRKRPRGDGHPVIVFPGFLTSEISTRPLRRFLTNLGYQVHDWSLGRNLRHGRELDDEIQAMVEKRFVESGQKVTLIGWSLGGIFAREFARNNPDMVRNVVSLGSPIAGPQHVTLIGPIYQFLNGKFDPDLLQKIENLKKPLPVPSSVIYSKNDGIMHWHGARQAVGDLSENIHVPASHLGMGSNPLVLYVLADRLRQAEHTWSPFKASGRIGRFYRKEAA